MVKNPEKLSYDRLEINSQTQSTRSSHHHERGPWLNEIEEEAFEQEMDHDKRPKQVKFFTPKTKSEKEKQYRSWKENLFREITGEKKVQSIDINRKWEDSTYNLDRFLRTHPHSHIAEKLNRLHIGEICHCGTPNKPHTVLHTVVENATNWDQLVKRQLDKCLHIADEQAEDENDPLYAALVDFRPIFGYKQGLIQEILNLGHKDAQIVFSHPVMEAYLYIEGKKHKYSIWISFVIYLIFAIAFFFHQLNIFYFRDASFVNAHTFPGCFHNGHAWECACGLLTLISMSVLVLNEIMLFLTFRLRYYKRVDAWLKQLVYLLVAIGFIMQQELEQLVFVTCISVPLSWIVLILISGYHGFTLPVMFLHILHKRFFSGMLLTASLAIAFGSGLLFSSYRFNTDLTLIEYIASIFRPILMIMGEYEFNAFYEKYHTDYVVFVYSSVMLVCMALAGSLVLVNLLLGLILSDISHLYVVSRNKELFRRARQIVFSETLAKTVFKWFKPAPNPPGEITICLHNSCHCDNIKVSKAVKQKLKKLLKKNGERRQSAIGRPKTGHESVLIEEIL